MAEERTRMDRRGSVPGSYRWFLLVLVPFLIVSQFCCQSLRLLADGRWTPEAPGAPLRACCAGIAAAPVADAFDPAARGCHAGRESAPGDNNACHCRLKARPLAPEVRFEWKAPCDSPELASLPKPAPEPPTWLAARLPRATSDPPPDPPGVDDPGLGRAPPTLS